MASLPAIAEGPAAEEQMLLAEASSVSRNADLKKMRQDKREFIKVSGFQPAYICHSLQQVVMCCSQSSWTALVWQPISPVCTTCRLTEEPLQTAQSLGRLLGRSKARICHPNSGLFSKTIGYEFACKLLHLACCVFASSKLTLRGVVTDAA